MTKVLRYSAALLFVTALSLLVGGSAAAQSTNNPRYRQFRDTAAASITTPASGNVRLFFDSTGFYWKNSAGVSTAVGGGGFTLTQYNIPMAATTTTLGDSKMNATAGGSSTGRGIWTLYDDTATNGVTSFVIKEGEADVNSNNYLLKFISFGGVNRGGVIAGINEINFRGDRYNDAANNNFQLGASSGLALIDTIGIIWATGSYYNAAHSGILPSASGILKVTNGSTGIGALATARPFAAYTDADSPVTVTGTLSNYVFSNTAAAGAVTFNLPVPVAGMTYTFVSTDADDLIIDADATSTIFDGTTESAGDDTATMTDIGCTVTIVAVSSTQWFIVSKTGTVTLS